MASRIVSLIIDCEDPEALAAFWAEVLGWRISARGWQRSPAGATGATIASGDGPGIEIDFRWVPEVARVTRNRMHLDINPTDRDQAVELRRLRDLGARPVDVGPPRVTWHVLADPEGNEFCLCRDRVDP